MRRVRTLSLLALLALAPVSRAQDSVSKLHAVPGDALDPHDLLEQRNDYVVDLSAIESSWGNVWALGPIVKGSWQRRTLPEFYTALISAQAISRDELVGVPFASTSYSLWSAAGAGVNHDPSKNDPGQALDTTGRMGTRFAAGFAEFATGDLSMNLNQAIGALVDRDPLRPSRLYVSRFVAAVNSPDDACNLAEIGFGAIDADGALHFRCDDSQGLVAPCNSIPSVVGNNLVRVRLPARNTATLNLMQAGSGSDAAATDFVLAGDAVVHNPPCAIPTSVAGRPLAIASNFAIQYVHEAAPGALTATQAHKVAAALDHRGNVAWSPQNFPGLLGASTHGTAAMLGINTIQATNLILVWGLDASGAPTAARALALPSPLTTPNYFEDRDDGFKSTDLGLAFPVFDHYHSQVAFRGGNGQVALGRDPADGSLLAAALVHLPNVGSPQTDDNAIAVGKLDAQGQTSWTIAAWTVNEVPITGGALHDDGKRIYDAAGNSLGRLLGAGHLGGGPSFSAPMMDAAGNVWFLSSVELGGQQSVALLRAVLDPARFAYRLELVLRQGDVIAGRNSQRDYQIAFLDVWDSNSVSSGTAFSGNVTAGAWDGADPATLAQGDPRALGGLVIKATIVYDVDQDGQFVRSTGTSGTPGSPDEDYQVLLYLAPSGDCDRDGVPDDAEIGEGSESDADHNGLPDSCQVAVGFCPGDGSLAPCPGVGSTAGCANGASGHGCANSGNPAGAVLEAYGDVTQGALTLFLRGLPAGSGPTVFLLRGTQQVAPTTFGDGLRCVQPSGGALFVGVGGNGALRIPVTHPGSAGTSLYQAFYRSTSGFCLPQAFNVSSGVAVAWP